MPEPTAAKDSEREDEFDMENDDVFNYPDGTVAHITHVTYVLKALACLMLLTGYVAQERAGWKSMESQDWAGCFWGTTVSGMCASHELFYNMVGMHSRALNNRCIVFMSHFGTTVVLSNRQDLFATAGGQDHSHNGTYHATKVEDNWPAVLFAAIVTIKCWILPRRYGDRSFYGRYCCEAFQEGRMARIEVIFVMVEWQLARVVAPTISSLASIRDAAFQGVVYPLIVFGWKRVYYLLSSVLVLEDSCFKNNTVWHIMTKLLSANFGVAGSGCGASELSAAASLIVMDWLLFGLRTSLLLRIGQKQCPKVFGPLLDSALSSIITPLNKPKKALGVSSAMRQCQAYTCILEGLTLSIAFSWFLLNAYILNYVIAGDERLVQLFPGRSILIPLVLTFADVLQDLAGSRATDKFSSWTTIFHYFWGPQLRLYTLLMFFHMCSHIRIKFAVTTMQVTMQRSVHPITSWNPAETISATF